MAATKYFEHLAALYKLLTEDHGFDEDSRLWVGNQREMIARLGLSHSYVALFSDLNRMDCVEKVQQGNAGKPTVLRLKKPPEIEQFGDARDAGSLTQAPTLRTLQSRLYALEQRLPEGVDLAAWIVGIERRLAAVEGE